MTTKQIKILIVDDEAYFLESMKKRLDMRGFHVVAVDRGIKAVETARKNPVDIAILDLKMPGMNGSELLQVLKREHPWIEVIILTGHGGADEEIKCVLDGAHAYLYKPCTLEDLLDAVTKAYKRRIMKKYDMPEERLNALMEEHHAKANPMAALNEMKKLEDEILKR